MIRVAVSGAGGRLAGPIIAAIDSADDLELASLYNPNRPGQEIAGVEITPDPGQVNADVLVETVGAGYVLDNLRLWDEAGMAAVVGSSGFTAERIELLGEIWKGDRPCLVVPNFSIGAVLMMRFAREIADKFDAVEIIERHHAHKPDAPSGTALATAMEIGRAGGASIETSRELEEGARGASVEGVRVHSVRLPGLLSHQEVVFSNAGEVLSVEHMSTSYESFAAGALMAIRGVGALSPGVHLGLDAVL